MTTVVKCPTCQTAVQWNADSPYRPFCCKRCQLIDLGEWAAEEKVIPGQHSSDNDKPPVDIEEIEAMLAKQQDDFFKD
ncbi:DNA gyrase inhibitor YacG [Aestuariibacter halophilus]|uniref:DNA gyrase inhibitor YacG n=1 Tax=Fluctibacter halophilus TaxID=226011 RepID=A0ABS8G7D9_9ALTE|nr:DNA gyrase inhibitor YacG [Aestuariibacter halophilus]MCC2616465.1 DNA gyrase inhibitor YacG [Aestuariibacter halophilus]